MVLLDLQAMEMTVELNGCGDDHGRGYGNGHSGGSGLSLLLCNK
ncbi:MAG: SapB/AmfS family lanthipeptide [Pseudonocardiaceae bacterium]